MVLDELAERQYAWVERMNWHNKEPLAALALVCSEIGETANECLNDTLSPSFGEELADIALRILDLSYWYGVCLEEVVRLADVEFNTKTVSGNLLELLIEASLWINTARGKTLELPFRLALGRVFKRVQVIAETFGVNLEEQILRKMAINEERGSRGRLK